MSHDKIVTDWCFFRKLTDYRLCYGWCTCSHTYTPFTDVETMLWMMTTRWHNVFKAQTHTCALKCCLHAHIMTYIHCHDRLSLKEDLLRHANSSVPSSQMSEDDPGMVKTKKYRKTTQCMQLEKDLTKPRAHTHTHSVYGGTLQYYGKACQCSDTIAV